MLFILRDFSIKRPALRTNRTFKTLLQCFPYMGIQCIPNSRPIVHSLYVSKLGLSKSQYYCHLKINKQKKLNVLSIALPQNMFLRWHKINIENQKFKTIREKLSDEEQFWKPSVREHHRKTIIWKPLVKQIISGIISFENHNYRPSIKSDQLKTCSQKPSVENHQWTTNS